MGDELWRLDAVEQAALVRRGEVSSRELVQAHLDRIEQVNPTINAIVRVLAERSLADADGADRAVAAGDELGQLHGVPMTVKENLDLAGTPTTNSLVAFADAVATVDAPVVERMRAAGAIPIGRTNMPDLGLRVTTDSSLHGVTRNPWDPSRTAGGSSGGEAAALATGMSPIGLGNDIGGSLRNPAHCCGIVSIKPTAGVVPSADTLPFEDSGMASQLMLVQGVMARRLADVRAGFLAVAGPHPRDPDAAPVTLASDPDVRRRVAVLADPPGGSTSPGVTAAVRAAADVLADAGHDVVDAVPPDYEEAIELWGAVLAGDLTVQLPLIEAVMGPGGLRFLELGRSQIPDADLPGWTTALTSRRRVLRHWQKWHRAHDVLLGPVWTQPAFAEGLDISDAAGAQAVMELLRPVTPMNLLGLPAAVTPAGMVDGVPVGVQVSGWRHTDLVCLDVAAEIEAVLGLPTPIDPRASRAGSRDPVSSRTVAGAPAGSAPGLTWVQREPLLQRALAARTVLLTSPGGFGKTTFAEQLAQRAELTRARVVLTGSTDAGALVSGLARALRRSGLSDAADAIADAGDMDALDRLLGSLAARPDPVLLTFDDAHLADEGAEAWLATLALDLPAGCRLVVAGRPTCPRAASGCATCCIV